MKKAFNLNIKSPCQENFEDFTTTPQGGFCNSCSQEVIDFTQMSPEEISAYFKNNNAKNICGRFKNKQLKTFSTPKKRHQLNFLSGISMACLALFSFGKTQAQETEIIKTKQPKIQTQGEEANIVVKGTVQESNLPLPGVNIILEGTTIGTSTDFDGNFEFPQKLQKGDILVFSYLGYESKKITITNKESAQSIELNIDMTTASCIIMGKVVKKSVYKSKRK
ncbi:carboxypeptidase-like regulatory domain-containing protein [Mangrovimonas spongiae]|uniref:Carboxypeptidase-like regulatory domain-containing protein n=1 Tax=Mangrovimonas spongiae TaxID=2494697 RepID=A0A428K2S4_9FLAO|nr:carboxypeptidase-like regulatory domain-containing protein [Mangrovimonas spongiae]RSK40574.1 hypothetical protein EJA19_06235 [Mangrovimonas spongiae]